MSSETTNILSNVVIALFTLLTTILVTVLLRRRKVVQFDVFSMPLIRFKPKQERNLILSVDRSVVTGNEDDKGEQQPITNAYGFEVEVKNVGNEDITEAFVEVRLHESARIIECETLPTPRTSYPVSIETDKALPHIRRFLIPYINRGEKFIIRLISTENENRDCTVNVTGLGIKIRRYPGIRLMAHLIMAITPALLIGVIGEIYPSFLTSLGAVTEAETITRLNTRFPVWLVLVFLIILIVPVLIVVWKNFNELFAKPRRIKESGSGGIVKVQDWDLDD